MNKIIKIEGLDCANCARELEEEIEKIDGVNSVTVDFMGMKVVLDCSEAALEKVKYCCNHFEEVKVVEDVPAKNPQPAGSSQSTGDNAQDVSTAPGRVYGEKIKIENLCCANCGRELEEQLNKIDGVEAVVDFMNMRVILNASTHESREKAIYAISHFEDVKIVSANQKKSVFKEHGKDIICIIAAAVMFIPALVLDLSGMATKDNLAALISAYVLYGLAYLTVGHPVLINTVKNISKGRIFDENFLMTIASLGAVALGIVSGDGFFEGVAVMLLYQLGELLQGIAVGASRNSISSLMDLKSDTATVIVDGEHRTVSPEDLRTGERILIRAGEKVPVDCKVLAGQTELDVKSLNGEPLPCHVEEGDEILSGSINLSGVIEAEVVREYQNSAVAKILELVENSTAKKSKPEKFITSFARYYTPAVCALAAVVAAVVPTIIYLINPAAGAWEVYKSWIYNALTFLVISCPCALVISVPLSYFGGIGRCARFGILVKGSTCLDELNSCTVAAFDKTGTVTEGTFNVKKYTDARTLSLAAAAEKYSAHPISAAFKNIPSDVTIDSAEELAGRGVKCVTGGKTLFVGNQVLLEENAVEFTPQKADCTLIYVALDGRYVGVIEVDDVVKAGVKEALGELRECGVQYETMLTGDSPARAAAVAAEVGLDGYSAGLLPGQKLSEAEKLKERGKLIYVGDGINDAPVMTAADCAVSMGKVGSDAAIEASDVVLVTDNLALLPKAKRIARGTKRIVIQNIVGSLFVKFGLMICDVVIAALIAGGLALSPFPLIVSVIADVGVMLIAVLNAMRTNILK